MNTKAFKRVSILALAMIFIITSLPFHVWSDDRIRLEGSRSVEKQDFMIAEDFTITYCIQPAGTLMQREPINVALVMDVSGSMEFRVSNRDSRTRMTVAKQSAKIITANFREAGHGDRIGLVTFANNPAQLSGLTTNYNLIDNYIDTQLRPNGGTNIQMGLNYGYRVVQNAPADTRSIILLTDGAASAYYMPFGSGYRLVQDSRGISAKQYARAEADAVARHGVPVYTIALATAGTDEVDLDLMDYITSKTGGQSFTATNPEELNEAFERILDLIEPSFNDVVLRQPLPAGFELAEDNTKARLDNGVLSMELGNIPFSEETAQCAYQVKLKFTGEPGTISLPQATVDYKLDGQPRQAIINDEIVLRFHDILGLQGTVGLKEELSSGQLAEWNKDHALTATYTLTPTGKTKNNQFNQLRNVKITHTLPEGVTVSTERSDPSLSVSDDGRTITFNIGNTTINDGYRFAKDVRLQFEHAGAFDLQTTGSAPYVEFTNNAGKTERVQLDNGLPELEVFVMLNDKWGNKYLGDGDGKVTRRDAEGRPQWHVDLGRHPVNRLQFQDDQAQSAVDVGFYGSDSDQQLNLLPTVPEVRITDYEGGLIAEGDTAYKRGYGKLEASGSRPGLPANTVYVDESFQADYIAYYEYRVDGGPWSSLLESSVQSIAENGENIAIDVRAVTKSIGDGAVNHYGAEKRRSVSLDGVPPVVPLIEDRHITINGGVYTYSIPDAFSDAHSGVRTDADGDKVFTVIVGGSSEVRKVNEAGLKVNIPIEQVRNGQAFIEVQDRVGNSKRVVLPEISDSEKPEIKITLTPKETYVRDGSQKVYEAQNGVREPFDYSTDERAALKIEVIDDQSDIRSFRYRLDDGSWQDVTSISGRQGEVSFVLKDRLPDSYLGWHKLEVEAADLFGNTAMTEYYFMINPGPSAEVTLAHMDGTPYEPNRAANKPVTVALQPDNPVDAQYGRNGVSIHKVYYMITDTAAAPALNSNDWSEIGALSMMLSREGESYVHFKAVDEMGIASLITSDKIHIDFNQNRY